MPDTGEYRVVSGTVITREGDDGEGVGELVRHKPGDVVTLRHAEADGKEVVPVEDEDDAESDESDAQSETTADTTEATDEANVTVDGTQSDESDAQSDGPPEPLTDEYLEQADYDDLRAAASNYDDINGNWGGDRLRAELAEKTE